ncbi:MAG: sugar ABC transporter permease [Treponema sp.]|nr:sugar ABC transporter permease [Treponema sp.]
MKKKSISHEGRDFALFTFPAMLFITLFVGIPFLMCILNSFRKWNGISRKTSFVGLKNYIKLITDDPSFVHALEFTFLYAFFVVIFINAVAIFLALLLERNIRAKGLFRMLFYIPNIISLIIIGFIWKFICIRVFEALGTISGMEFWNYSWLGDSKLAVITTVFVSVWQGLGFYMIIYIAGLQSVPDELIEAALIDGASSARRLFSVIFPMIMPSISFCMFYSVANSMKMFELIFSLTGGGPGIATTPVALDIYNTAFNNNNFGYGSAKSVVLFVIVCTISIIQVRFFKNKEVES